MRYWKNTKREEMVKVCNDLTDNNIRFDLEYNNYYDSVTIVLRSRSAKAREYAVNKHDFLIDK